MQQKIISVGHRMQSIDNYSFNLDYLTKTFNAEGWRIKQIVSTSFTHQILNGQPYPVVQVTLLVEKE